MDPETRTQFLGLLIAAQPPAAGLIDSNSELFFSDFIIF
jgi:hypothetical protein